MSKFLCVALFVNARKVGVSEFQVKNYAPINVMPAGGGGGEAGQRVGILIF